MKACTFFGHRDCPDTLKPLIRQTVERLVAEQGVDTFYMGNQGQFDACARRVLREMQQADPHISYAVVLAYLPTERKLYEDYDDTVFPEGMEEVHPRYAIDRRNRWMLERSEFVICYVARSWGGAARYVQAARRKGKAVINLFDLTHEGP